MKEEYEDKVELFEKRIGQAYSLLCFRLCNLCVKAEPASLLPVTVTTRNGEKNLEDVAQVGKKDWNVLMLFPFDEKLMKSVAYGVSEVHPEFEQEILELRLRKQEDGRWGVSEDNEGADDANSGIDSDEDGENGENEKKVKAIQLTMPTVNEKRRDVLNDGIDGVMDAFDAKVDFEKTSVMKKVDFKASEEAKEFEDALDEKAKKYKEMAEKQCNTKKKEVEDAYGKYLLRKEHADKKAEEDAAAAGTDVAFKFKQNGN